MGTGGEGGARAVSVTVARFQPPSRYVCAPPEPSGTVSKSTPRESSRAALMFCLACSSVKPGCSFHCWSRWLQYMAARPPPTSR